MAVQEYGASNPALLAGLTERGAVVTRVPVYQWALPEDLAPLRSAIETLVRGDIDVALFTTATQVTHLRQVAESMGLGAAVHEALNRIVVVSIGPTTSEELRDQGIESIQSPPIQRWVPGARSRRACRRIEEELNVLLLPSRADNLASVGPPQERRLNQHVDHITARGDVETP